MKYFPIGLLTVHSTYLFIFPQHISIASSLISLGFIALYALFLWQEHTKVIQDVDIIEKEKEIHLEALNYKQSLQKMEAELQEKRYQLQKFNIDNEYSLKSVSKTSEGPKKFSF